MPAMDWLFMLGLLGIGLAFLLGIGTRLAAVAIPCGHANHLLPMHSRITRS